MDKQVQTIVIDGTDLVAGRVCSNVAKLLLQGNHVVVLNCEKIMLSGNRRSIITEYKDFLRIHSVLHPEHGPYHPRRPDRVLARMVRGMLPREKPSGQAALRRLRTYIGIPSQFRSNSRFVLEKAKITRSPANYTTMGELSMEVGWTP